MATLTEREHRISKRSMAEMIVKELLNMDHFPNMDVPYHARLIKQQMRLRKTELAELHRLALASHNKRR